MLTLYYIIFHYIHRRQNHPKSGHTKLTLSLLTQKEAKDTLERKKQLRLEKRNNKKKHINENAKKPSSSKRSSSVIQNNAKLLDYNII